MATKSKTVTGWQTHLWRACPGCGASVCETRNGLCRACWLRRNPAMCVTSVDGEDGEDEEDPVVEIEPPADDVVEAVEAELHETLAAIAKRHGLGLRVVCAIAGDLTNSNRQHERVRVRQFTAAEDRRFRQLWEGGVVMREIAAILGKTVSQVNAARYRLKLRPRGRTGSRR